MTVRAFKMRSIQEDLNLFDVIYAGIYTTKGGAAAEVVNLRGVDKNDVAVATRHTTTTRTVDTVACGKNRVTVTFSADPSTNHKINLIVLRKRRGTSAARRKY